MTDSTLKLWVKNKGWMLAAARALRDCRRQAWGRLVRKTTIDRFRRRSGDLRVALGADDSDRDGWLATDYSPRRKGVVYLDATRRFPFADNEVDYFHAEHMIEHVSFAGGRAMLAECFRTLKPGGKLRLTTPDLSRLSLLLAASPPTEAALYARWSNQEFGDAYERRRPDNPVTTFNRIMREWGHVFLYDGPTMETALGEAGFVDIARCEVGESADPTLRGVELHGKKIGEAPNRFETMVFEASKPARCVDR